MKRDGLDLNFAGLRTDNFEANPVFLWAHDYQGRTLPIGKVQDLDKQGNQLRANAVFDTEDEFAMEVRGKYERGFLNTVSIGWETLNRSGNEITDSDLLDVSAVPVPGDPSALVDSQRAQLRSIAESLLDDETPSLDEIVEAVTVDGSRFDQAAVSMFQLYMLPDVGTAEQRQAVYDHLRGVYKKEGKVAPRVGTGHARTFGPAPVLGGRVGDRRPPVPCRCVGCGDRSSPSREGSSPVRRRPGRTIRRHIGERDHRPG